MLYKISNVGLGSLYAMRCPASNQIVETLSAVKHEGIGHVVSLLEQNEAKKLGVVQEADICLRLGMAYQNYPIKDFSTVVDRNSFIELVEDLHRRLFSGENIIVHCYAGIGRTGLLIGSILIYDDLPAKDAIEIMSAARGRNMPQTQEQYEYLLDLEETRLSVDKNKDVVENDKKGWFFEWLRGK